MNETKIYYLEKSQPNNLSDILQKLFFTYLKLSLITYPENEIIDDAEIKDLYTDLQLMVINLRAMIFSIISILYVIKKEEITIFNYLFNKSTSINFSDSTSIIKLIELLKNKYETKRGGGKKTKKNKNKSKRKAKRRKNKRKSQKLSKRKTSSMGKYTQKHKKYNVNIKKIIVLILALFQILYIPPSTGVSAAESKLNLRRSQVYLKKITELDILERQEEKEKEEREKNPQQLSQIGMYYTYATDTINKFVDKTSSIIGKTNNVIIPYLAVSAIRSPKYIFNNLLKQVYKLFLSGYFSEYYDKAYEEIKKEELKLIEVEDEEEEEEEELIELEKDKKEIVHHKENQVEELMHDIEDGDIYKKTKMLEKLLKMNYNKIEEKKKEINDLEKKKIELNQVSSNLNFEYQREFTAFTKTLEESKKDMAALLARTSFNDEKIEENKESINKCIKEIKFFEDKIDELTKNIKFNKKIIAENIDKNIKQIELIYKNINKTNDKIGNYISLAEEKEEYIEILSEYLQELEENNKKYTSLILENKNILKKIEELSNLSDFYYPKFYMITENIVLKFDENLSSFEDILNENKRQINDAKRQMNKIKEYHRKVFKGENKKAKDIMKDTHKTIVEERKIQRAIQKRKDEEIAAARRKAEEDRLEALRVEEENRRLADELKREREQSKRLQEELKRAEQNITTQISIIDKQKETTNHLIETLTDTTSHLNETLQNATMQITTLNKTKIEIEKTVTILKGDFNETLTNVSSQYLSQIEELEKQKIELEKKLEQIESENKQLALDVVEGDQEYNPRGVSKTTFSKLLKEQEGKKEMNYLDYWMYEEQDRDSIHDIGKGLTSSLNFPYETNIKYVPEVIKQQSKPKFDKTMTDYSADMLKSFSDFFNKESPQSIFNGFQDTASKLNEEFSSLSANSNSICNTVMDKFFKEELLTDDDIMSMLPKKIDKFFKPHLGTTATVSYNIETPNAPNYDLLRRELKKKIKEDFCISFEPVVQFDYKSIQGIDNSDNKIFFLSLYFRGPKGSTITGSLQTNDGIATSLLTYQSLVQSFLHKINTKKEKHKEKSKGYFTTDKPLRDKYLILEDLSGKFELLGEAIELIETNLIFYSPELQDKKFFNKGVQQITNKLGKLEEKFEHIKYPLSKFEMNEKMLTSLGINLDKIASDKYLEGLRTELVLTAEENSVITELLKEKKIKDKLARESNSLSMGYYVSMILSPFKMLGDETFNILYGWMISFVAIFTPILILSCCIKRNLLTFNLRRPPAAQPPAQIGQPPAQIGQPPAQIAQPQVQPQNILLPPAQPAQPQAPPAETIVLGDGNGNAAILTLQDNNVTVDGVVHQLRYNNNPELNDIEAVLTLKKYVLSIDDNGVLQCYKFLRIDKSKNLARAKFAVEDEAGVKFKLSYDEIIDPVLNNYDNFNKNCAENNDSPVVILEQIDENADLPPLLTASPHVSPTGTPRVSPTGTPLVLPTGTLIGSPRVSDIGTPGGTPPVLLTGLSLVLPTETLRRSSRESTPVLPRGTPNSSEKRRRLQIIQTQQNISSNLRQQLKKSSKKKTKKNK